MLQARFLGQFEVLIDGAPIAIPARKAQSLFAYLILNSENQHRREKLAGIFWPDFDESSARSKLRYALWQLRSALGDQYFTADKITIAFNPDAEYWVDCIELEKKPGEHLSTNQLEQLASFYQDDFLPGFYEEWIFIKRDQLRAAFNQRVALLINRLSIEQRWSEAIEWAERWIYHEQSRETAYQALMVAHSQLGDKASALRVYSRLEKILDEELGVEPSEVSKQLFEQIQQDKQPDAGFDFYAAPLRDSTGKKTQYPVVPETIQEAEPEVIVAREKELAWLDDKLQFAHENGGQLALIAGDAGQGKTALLKKFGLEAQRLHEDLVIAYATCESFTDLGDPYLPFRNVLALLCGDVAVKQSAGVINQENAQRLWEIIPLSAQALINGGPDLLDGIVAGEMLVKRANSFTLDRPEWLEDLEREVDVRRSRPIPVNVDHGDSRKDFFDQYTRVLQMLSLEQPLLLILDDLQWADPGSLGLLFHLARRIGEYPILILGSYRPAGITQVHGASPYLLADLLPELRRIFGDLELDLNQSDQDNRRKFVEDYHDTEPNNFGPDFRQALYLQTNGQPLFTVELLRQMQEQDSIVKDGQGRWVVGEELSWKAMPAKVEAVIEGRINRLSPELREILDVASVEGEEFTGELIAGVTGMSESSVIHLLSRVLARHHRLIEVSEIKRSGPQRLSIYRFRHNLFQKYVYDNLDLAERSHLHERVGSSLERLYGDNRGSIAAQLAKHYELAGLIDKAIDYLLTAGKHAKRISANDQAVSLLGRGIDLINQLPEKEQLAEIELAFQISLGTALVATQGYASDQVESAFDRARELCEQTGDVEQLAPALWGLTAFYQVRGKHRIAFQMSQQIHGIADKSGDPDLLLLGHWMLGFSHTHLGEFTEARDHIEAALSLYDSSRDEALTFLYGQNPRVTCLNYLAINLWILGYLDESIEKCEQAGRYAEQLSHPYSLTFAHGTAALFHAVRRDSKSALMHSEMTYKLAKKSGFPFFLALGMLIRGWARSQSGKMGMAKKLVENGFEAMQAIGTELGRPFFLSLMAETKGNESQDSFDFIRLAADMADENQELWFLSVIHWLWGTIGERKELSRYEVFKHYKRAVEIAAEQEARSFILRAAVAMFRFDDGGEGDQMARDLLVETYHWFKTGFSDQLLVEAEVLIKSFE